jgi:4-hydroxybenzoate polyprenyltransferase
MELSQESNVTALWKVFVSSRPISWVNTAFPFGLSYFLVTGSVDLVLVVGSFFFLIPYNLLMYGINDVFDYESDLRNPRKGGLEGALLEPRFHKFTLWISIGFYTPFLLAMYLLGNLLSGILLTLLTFTVIAYSLKGLRFKEIPFLDSVTSASHFVGPLLVGLAMAEVEIWTFEITPWVLAFTLWGMASHAFGAVQDIQADRTAKISSIATALGAKNTVRFAFACYLAAALLVLISPWPAPLTAIAALPYLVIIAPYLSLEDQNCERANRGWRHFIKLNYLAGAIITLIVI